MKELIESFSSFQDNNTFIRIIRYSILLGGDTDTIASMAGSIAGAYLGFSAIPQVFASCCEGFQDACDQADELHQVFIN